MSQTYQLGNTGGDFAQGNIDIVFDAVGSLVLLEDQDKLVQDVKKILFTPQNYFYAQYSTKLEQAIGTTPDINVLKQTLAQQVTSSLLYLQALQNEQSTYQTVTAGETLANINSIGVTYEGDISTDEASLTTFLIEASISNGLRQNVLIASPVAGNTNGS